jgi:hypothetical protein
MPLSVPKLTLIRDLEMPNTSPMLVIRLDISKDKVKDNITLTLAINKSQLSLNLLSIYIGLISRPILALY